MTMTKALSSVQIRDEIIGLIEANPEGMTSTEIDDVLGFEQATKGQSMRRDVVQDLERRGLIRRNGGKRGPWVLACPPELHDEPDSSDQAEDVYVPSFTGRTSATQVQVRPGLVVHHSVTVTPELLVELLRTRGVGVPDDVDLVDAGGGALSVCWSEQL